MANGHLSETPKMLSREDSLATDISEKVREGTGTPGTHWLAINLKLNSPYFQVETI